MITKNVIRWTEDEWDELAAKVCLTRKNSPDSVVSIANRLQKQFPANRQRPGILTTLALQPLVERVQAREREEKRKAEICDALEAKLTFFENLPTTRDELIRDLTDEELQKHFLHRLLKLMTPDDLKSVFSVDQLLSCMSTGDLAAVVAKRLVERLEEPTQVFIPMVEQQKPSVNRSKTVTNGKLKKIVVIGIKGDEGRYIREGIGNICDLVLLEVKDLRKENVPRNADLIILWSKFVSHSHRDTIYSAANGRKIDEHFFGVKEMIKKIKNFCHQVPVSV